MLISKVSLEKAPQTNLCVP